MYKIIFVFCLALCAILAKNEVYDGHALYEIDLQTREQGSYLADLESRLNLDVWSHGRQGIPAQVLVSKTIRPLLESGLAAVGIGFKVAVENIKEQLDLEEKLLSEATAKSNRTRSNRLSFDTIHRYAAVDAYLVELANQFPNIVTAVSAGKSFEGRDIKYLKISTTNFQDRYWRKSRATGFIDDDIGPSVDLNRNFDYLWSHGNNFFACLETFHGNYAFSEPETAIVRDIVYEYRGRIELFLDLHSFGSLILYGYGDGILPPNGLIIHLNGIGMAQAIDAVKWPSNKNYVVGNSALVLYSASGIASDFAQATGVPLSYTYEMPAHMNFETLTGFLVDPAFIEQAGFETWQGIKAGARFAVNNYRARYSRK